MGWVPHLQQVWAGLEDLVVQEGGAREAELAALLCRVQAQKTHQVHAAARRQAGR